MCQLFICRPKQQIPTKQILPQISCFETNAVSVNSHLTLTAFLILSSLDQTWKRFIRHLEVVYLHAESLRWYLRNIRHRGRVRWMVRQLSCCFRRERSSQVYRPWYVRTTNTWSHCIDRYSFSFRDLLTAGQVRPSIDRPDCYRESSIDAGSYNSRDCWFVGGSCHLTFLTGQLLWQRACQTKSRCYYIRKLRIGTAFINRSFFKINN